MAQYTFLATTFAGVPIEELPLANVNFSMALNDAGGLTADLNTEDEAVKKIDWVTATAPAKTILLVLRNGTILWSGIIWTRRRKPGGIVSIQGSELISYFGRRVIRSTLSYSATNAMTVAYNIATAMITGSGFNIGVGSGTSLFATNYVANYYEYKNALDEIKYLSDGGSFDIGVESTMSGAGAISHTFRCWSPHRGVPVSGASSLVFESPGSILDFDLAEDGTRVSSATVATGKGDGASMVTGLAIDGSMLQAGFPLLDTVISYPNESNTVSLAQAAAINQMYSRDILTVSSCTVHPSANPELGTYQVGDHATVVIEDPGMGTPVVIDTLDLGLKHLNLLTANQATLESGATTGWAAFDANSSISAGTDPYAGVYALRIGRPSTTGSPSAITPTGSSGIPVNPGARYIFTMRHKYEVTNRSACIYVYWYQSNGTASSVNASEALPTESSYTTGWSDWSACFTSPIDAAYCAIRIVGGSATTVGEYLLVDNIGMWAADPDDILLDATSESFEGDIGTWVSLDSDVSLSASTNFAYRGNYSMRVERTSGTGAIRISTPTGSSGYPVSSGESLVASMRMRCDVTARNFRLRIDYFDSSGSSLSSATGAAAAGSTSAWAENVVSDIVPSGAAYAALVLDLYSTSITTGEYHYIDDVTFYRDGAANWRAPGSPKRVFDGEQAIARPRYQEEVRIVGISVKVGSAGEETAQLTFAPPMYGATLGVNGGFDVGLTGWTVESNVTAQAIGGVCRVAYAIPGYSLLNQLNNGSALLSGYYLRTTFRARRVSGTGDLGIAWQNVQTYGAVGISSQQDPTAWAQYSVKSTSTIPASITSSLGFYGVVAGGVFEIDDVVTWYEA